MGEKFYCFSWKNWGLQNNWPSKHIGLYETRTQSKRTRCIRHTYKKWDRIKEAKETTDVLNKHSYDVKNRITQWKCLWTKYVVIRSTLLGKQHSEHIRNFTSCRHYQNGFTFNTYMFLPSVFSHCHFTYTILKLHFRFWYFRLRITFLNWKMHLISNHSF